MKLLLANNSARFCTGEMEGGGSRPTAPNQITFLVACQPRRRRRERARHSRRWHRQSSCRRTKVSFRYEIILAARLRGSPCCRETFFSYKFLDVCDIGRVENNFVFMCVEVFLGYRNLHIIFARLTSSYEKAACS